VVLPSDWVLLAWAAAAAFQLPVFWNFLTMSVVVIVVISVAMKFIPSMQTQPAERDADQRSQWERFRSNLQLWKDVRLLLIGLMMLGMAFTEGSANDWLSLASVDGHGSTATAGALVYAAFVAAMTIGRVCGGPLIDRYGRVPVLAIMAVTGIAGVLLFILAATPWLTFAGAVLWGVGGSLGFPVGMSAAADHPTEATRRVSIVAIFGYAAFLIGPPVLGFLGQSFGILNALYVVIGLLVLSLVTSPNAGPAKNA
jgi:MFS family permease